MALDPQEEWEKLNRRVDLSYYIGQPAVDCIGSSIDGEAPGQYGVDVDIDGDGDPDITITKIDD